MKLSLNDGRSELWQWDTGRTLAVDADCSQVHFSNKVFGRSIDVDVVNGTAVIPDILLQTDNDLNVWAFVGTAENGYTKISKTFKVNRRNKPADYVFTPPDQATLAELSGRLDRIEESQDPDAIKNAVEGYLAQNPVEAPVQSVNGQTGAVELNAEDVGAIAKTELHTAINTALAQAKASGEFDGADGADGGYYTPAVTQTAENTMQVSFTPSKTTMPAVDGTEITLPAGPAGAKGADGKSAYQYAVEGGYTGTEAEFAAKLAAEKFANPNALTFTGAVTGSYDGSEAVSVEIPQGGGIEWQTILTGETTVEAVTTVTIPMTASDFDEYRAVIVVGKNTDGTTGDNNTNIWIDGYRCAYYMIGVNYGNYIGTFSISVEPIPETVFLEPNGSSVLGAKKSTVSRWITSPAAGASNGISAIICPNTSPTGVLRIQFGKAYSGTIIHEVMAR